MTSEKKTKADIEKQEQIDNVDMNEDMQNLINKKRKENSS